MLGRALANTPLSQVARRLGVDCSDVEYQEDAVHAKMNARRSAALPAIACVAASLIMVNVALCLRSR